MKTLKNIRMFAALALGMVLAACSQSGPEGQPLMPDGTVTVSIGLDSAAFRSQSAADGFTVLGSPFDVDGKVAVTEAQVAVTDKDDRIVGFDFDSSSNTYDFAPDGGTTHITLTQAKESATVMLPAAGNPYSFESRGYQDTSDGVIAYELQQHVVVNEHDTVWINLESVLGSAVLVPRYPTNFATPGKPLDLMLIVMANNHGGFPTDHLQVPLSDFEIPDGYIVTGATEVNSSKRGIRVTVDQYCSTVSVAGTVRGLLESNGAFIDGTISINGDDGFELACPSLLSGNLATDLTPPTVTGFAYDVITGEVTGEADDDYGIASVQVFDGPVLLASTIQDEVDDGAKAITFDAGSTTFHANVGSAISGGLLAIAFDPSGNEGRSAETVDLTNIWVDASAPTGGDGSETHPFQTIQQGVDAVTTDGTGNVWVRAGEYVEQVTIANSIRLAGASGSSVTVRAPNTLTAAENSFSIIDVTGSGTDASISNMAVAGPFPESIDCDRQVSAGIRVAQDAQLSLSDTEIIDTRGEVLPYCSRAIGLLLGLQSNKSPAVTVSGGKAILDNVSFSGGDKWAILVDGPDASLVMKGGTIQSETTNTGQTGRNGIGVFGNGSARINGVEFNDFRYDGPTWTATALLVDTTGSIIIEDSVFSGNQSALGVDDAAATNSTVTFRRNTINRSSAADWFITNWDASTVIDATDGNIFDGISPDNATLAELFTIERRIAHLIDGAGLGVVQIVPEQWYVTRTSSESSAGLKRALAAASPGDTINVEAGTYNFGGHIVLDKEGITLRGPNADVPFAGSRDGAAEVTGGFVISAANVTVSGFDIKDFGSHLSQLTPFYLREGMTGVTISNNIVSGSGKTGIGVVNETGTNVEALITGNTFRELTTGTYSNPGGNYMITNNLFDGNTAGNGNVLSGEITGNTYLNNDEGIGLSGNDIIVSGNTFDASNTVHVEKYAGNSVLQDILDDDSNSFPSGATVDGTRIE